MRALIYGISDQDGAYLAKHLLEMEYEVWGASRDVGVVRFGLPGAPRDPQQGSSAIRVPCEIFGAS